MKKMLRMAATAITSLSLVGGFAGVVGASSGTNSNTGPDSTNIVRSTSHTRSQVTNTNSLDLDNTNRQSAFSGDAVTRHNTRAGDATSGQADNSNTLNVTATVNNTRSSHAIRTSANTNNTGINRDTGPDSTNRVIFNTTNSSTVRNNNTINIENDNTQTSSSGDARVSDNTRGGSATSGDATNTNSTRISLNVSN